MPVFQQWFHLLLRNIFYHACATFDFLFHRCHAVCASICVHHGHIRDLDAIYFDDGGGDDACVGRLCLDGSVGLCVFLSSALLLFLRLVAFQNLQGSS